MKPRVKDIIGILERYFPLHLAEDWDNVGLQVGSAGRETEKIAVALDLTHEVLDQARREGAQMIITHHPLIFKGLKNIRTDGPTGSLIRQLIQADISLYTAHTNLDNAPAGLNQVLAEHLGLSDIEPLSLTAAGRRESLYKLVVFVPGTHVEEVRQAINNAGAGFIGRYSDCSYRSAGIGTFKPGTGTKPYLGQPGHLEEVEEYRLETICPSRLLQATLGAMQAAHPYEEVAYDVYRLENQGRVYSPGRKGILPEPMTLGHLARQVSRQLAERGVRVVGDPDRQVQRAAVVSGAGASFIGELFRQPVDVLITGDLKYHEAREAAAHGLAVIDAGHQATEEIAVSYLCRLLQQECAQSGYAATCIPMQLQPAWRHL